MCTSVSVVELFNITLFVLSYLFGTEVTAAATFTHSCNHLRCTEIGAAGRQFLGKNAYRRKVNIDFSSFQFYGSALKKSLKSCHTVYMPWQPCYAGTSGKLFMSMMMLMMMMMISQSQFKLFQSIPSIKLRYGANTANETLLLAKFWCCRYYRCFRIHVLCVLYSRRLCVCVCVFCCVAIRINWTH